MRLGKKGELVFSVGPSGRRSLAVKSAKRSKHENSQLFYWSEKPTPQEDKYGAGLFMFARALLLPGRAKTIIINP